MLTQVGASIFAQNMSLLAFRRIEKNLITVQKSEKSVFASHRGGNAAQRSSKLPLDKTVEGSKTRQIFYTLIYVHYLPIKLLFLFLRYIRTLDMVYF
jgi:hypothetical protein